MEFIEVAKNIILTQYDWYKFLTSEWLYFRLGPVCLVIESIITYILVAKKDENESAEERKKSLKFYWKINIWKISFVLFLTYLILSGSGRFTYSRLMGIVLFYYFYTAVLVAALTISLFAKVVKKAVGKDNIE
ncbi:hypothetical protein AAU61_03265 [Desulfocarbo indianensis]|nr:hypothetical protein AAU61_03265 [Desulfocarbo indianensis]